MARYTQRLRLGPIELVPAGQATNRQRLWALPGGARATLGEIAEHARRMGWPKPLLITVSRQTEKGSA